MDNGLGKGGSCHDYGEEGVSVERDRKTLPPNKIRPRDAKKR